MKSIFKSAIITLSKGLRSPLSLSLLLTSLSWGCMASFSQIIETSQLDRVISLEIPPEKNSSGGLIVADVNQDNQRDFIVTKPGIIAVYDNTGQQLWVKSINLQLTPKAEAEGLPGLHAPGVQAGDINGDGKTELLFLTTDNQLQIFEGASGKTLKKIQLKSPQGTAQWEHLVIANFEGTGDRDLLLQATNAKDYRMGRYLAAYSINALLNSNNPQPLWTRDDFVANAHNGVRVADIDGDSLDEVLGGTIISAQGEILFKIPLKGHIDSLFVADVRPDLPGLEVLALEEGGENRVFLYNSNQLIWETHYQNQEPQNAAIGDFDLNRPGLEIWCRSRYNTNQKPFIFDAQGQLISNYEMSEVAPRGWTNKGVEVIVPLHWTGEPQQVAVAKERHKSGDVGIFNPITGEFIERFPQKTDRLYVADVSGDWREELIILNGNQLYIYQNPEPNPNPNRASLWTQQHYRRSKMTWNYYSP